MNKSIVICLCLLAICALQGCAAVPYYDDASVHRIGVGDQVKLRLIGGDRVALRIAEVDSHTLVGEDGTTIEKRDVDSVKVRIPADEIPCSSLASWRSTDCVLGSIAL